jgi:hypothetical protein
LTEFFDESAVDLTLASILLSKLKPIPATLPDYGEPKTAFS